MNSHQVGLAGVLPESGNQFSKRLLLLFSFPSEFPKSERYTAVGLRKMYGNFDVVLDQFSRISQLYATPRAPWGVACVT